MVDSGLDFSLSIRIAHLARKRRHTVVRQDIAIQGIQARIVEVRRQHALAKVVQHDDTRRSAKPAKCLLVKLGPHPRTRFEDQQTNTLATAAQRQHEQPRAPVLATVRIAHHGAGAEINLALFTKPRLDDHSRFRRCGSAQRAHQTLDALVAAGEPVPVYQILPDTHRVAAPR